MDAKLYWKNSMEFKALSFNLKGRTGFKMSEMVYVGEERLVGEVIYFLVQGQDNDSGL